MKNYIVIIRRNILPSWFTRQTGIDLSHTDMTNVKCVEIEEVQIKGKRDEIFSGMLRTLGPLGGNVTVRLA